MFDYIDKYADAIAVIDSDREITYSNLINDANRLYEMINARCLTVIVCRNEYASLVGYISFLRNKIVPLLVNDSIDTGMFDGIVDMYRPEYVWQPIGYSHGEVVYTFDTYELIRLDNDSVPMAPELALLLTTSGSTGSQKFVKQTYANIESNANSIIEYLGMEPTDRAITNLPMSYTYGLSIINSHLMIGASIVLTGYAVVQREFYELFNKYKVNNMGGVPYTYEMLLRMRFERMDLPSIKYLTQAGGKLSKELHKKYTEICKDKGIKFIVMYGQTEATARMSYLPWEASENKIGSIGIAIPGGKFELWDDDKNVITQPDCQGELIYKGPNVTMGYALGVEDLITGDERNGILETGDMACMDEDGYYYIVGRKKRFLKVYGNRINLDELDSILKEEGISAVTAGEDDHIKVFYENGNGDEIVELLSRRLSIYKKAFTAVPIDKIPRNESGKIIYSKLQ